jgi:hypothetical protein
MELVPAMLGKQFAADCSPVTSVAGTWLGGLSISWSAKRPGPLFLHVRCVRKGRGDALTQLQCVFTGTVGESSFYLTWLRKLDRQFSEGCALYPIVSSLHHRQS